MASFASVRVGWGWDCGWVGVRVRVGLGLDWVWVGVWVGLGWVFSLIISCLKLASQMLAVEGAGRGVGLSLH